MKLASLKSLALVIDIKGDGMQLGAGSTIGIINTDSDVYRQSVLSPQDKMIGYVNTKGKFVPGWIGQHVKLGQPISKKPETIVPEGDERLHPWDELRQDLDGMTPDSRDLRWWSKRAIFVVRAVREFGATPVDDVAENVRKLCKQVHAEPPQLEGKTMGTATAKSKSKSAAKKGNKKSENGAPKRMFSRTVGQDIIRIAKFAGVSVPSSASKLANDSTLSRKELLSLRDSVNETSAELRESDSDKGRIAALAFSHAVMGVQRLSREAK